MLVGRYLLPELLKLVENNGVFFWILSVWYSSFRLLRMCQILLTFSRSQGLRPEGQLLVFESMASPEHDVPYEFNRLMP